jgi:predicted DsbA family dithiol-disulfide isomerase
MKIDIWSDVMCPFCYIGKRKLEAALEQFPHKDNIEIVWHSYQLDPELDNKGNKNLFDYLAARKGQSREWSVKVHKQMSETAREVGLTYNFETAVVANSFDAHRLIQLAKSKGLGGEAEERLFRAYYTDSKNIADHETLISLGREIGLQENEVKEMLQSDALANEVQRDIQTAQAIGVRGVPFFVLNQRYSISGAQPSDTFLEALQHAWDEYEKEKLPEIVSGMNGDVCSIDGNC